MRVKRKVMDQIEWEERVRKCKTQTSRISFNRKSYGIRQKDEEKMR